MNIMGQRIREKRTEKGLSLEALGKLLGVQRAAVSKWELGSVENISQSKIKEMSKIFDCSPSWLMGYDEDYFVSGDDGHEYFLETKKQGTNSHSDIEVTEALALYERYKNAIPQVQSAVEALLKPSQSDP